MNKRVVKLICLVLITMMMGTAFIACGPGDGNSASNGDETAASEAPSSTEDAEVPAKTPDLKGIKVTFWNGFTASDGDILREIFNKFNQTNELGIEVQMDIMPWANMLEKLAPALATGTAPTIILLGSDAIPEYASTGGLIELDDFWLTSGLNQSIYAQNVQDTFKFKGKTFGIPMQYNTMYLYWNKDLFTKAGLNPDNPPKTFTELKQYAAKITDESKEQYGFGIATGNANITNFIWSNGGDWLNKDHEDWTKMAGFENIRFLKDPDMAMPLVALMTVWKSFGLNMIILVAGIQAIPDDYYEAARIDGANKTMQFIHITIPLLIPTLGFCVITNTISSFMVFDQTYVMTGGGPMFRTETLAQYVYLRGFSISPFRLGYASATAEMLFLFIAVISIFMYNFFMKSERKGL